MAGIYLHGGLRGSNNRLNERSATRVNAYRLFDSQNNERGGYNVGDLSSDPFVSESGQFKETIFGSEAEAASYLTLEWTNQHGCGRGASEDKNIAVNRKVDCQIVLQYMCDRSSGHSSEEEDVGGGGGVRNGAKTESQQYIPPARLLEIESERSERKNVSSELGLHESWEFYDRCYFRQNTSNLRLFDKRLTKNNLGYSSAIHTRQNVGGSRYGYECPEERDYYPYWHSSPWIDIAVDDPSYCSMYSNESANVVGKFECFEVFPSGTRKASMWNNAVECERHGGDWVQLFTHVHVFDEVTSEAECEAMASDADLPALRVVWGLPQDAMFQENKCLLRPEGPPDCVKTDWTRVNHLGNAKGSGQAMNYTWLLPTLSPSVYGSNPLHCAIRLRYNISTEDYDGWGDAQSSSLITISDPLLKMAKDRLELKLALDTSHTGRVFQDRSHAFLLSPRREELRGRVLYNLNVRGKRGNIVQVYPAVEYDFIPNRLSLSVGQCVHAQWAGSNTHNNRRPSGDGASGADGQGLAGTDRSNLVQILRASMNFPLAFESTNFWSHFQLLLHFNNITNPSRFYESISSQDLALYFASSGYYQCVSATTCANSYEDSEEASMDSWLNNSPASFPGAVVCATESGTYHYMSTRNNNFSNRSQKGWIIVQ